MGLPLFYRSNGYAVSSGVYWILGLCLVWSDACSACVHEGFLRVLWFPFKKQKTKLHTSVNKCVRVFGALSSVSYPKALLFC